jgi:hypothetical protein
MKIEQNKSFQSFEKNITFPNGIQAADQNYLLI